ncbi:hypothetical protein WMY93_034203, partial [Mugilogobius chulae]
SSIESPAPPQSNGLPLAPPVPPPLSSLSRLYLYSLHGLLCELLFTSIWDFCFTGDLRLQGHSSLWALPIIELRTPRDFRLSGGHFGSNMNSATGSSTAETFKPSDISAEEDVPDLRYPDIYNFLINFPLCYSGDSLKAYKSLEGYKWTQSGFVTNIQLWNLQAKNVCIITGRVHHSQRLNDPQLKPWVVARKDGVVLGAHCNCTAGLAFPPLTAAEQDQLYHNLSQCRTQEGQIIKPVVLSVIREYAASYIPKAVMLDLPQPLTSLYDKQAEISTLQCYKIEQKHYLKT